VFEAKKRFVKDTGGEAIAQSMQLIAGRTAQEYNQRKNRHGAFWEDRYHATAVQGTTAGLGWTNANSCLINISW